MADGERRIPDAVPVDVPGGPTRPSLLVELPEYPLVARRRELDDRLLLQICGNNGDGVTVAASDLDLLNQVAQERFNGPGGELLRRRAVLALGRIDSPRAVARLVALGLDPAESEAVRIAALSGLPRDRLRALAPRLRLDAASGVREFLRYATTDLASHAVDREPPRCADVDL